MQSNENVIEEGDWVRFKKDHPMNVKGDPLFDTIASFKAGEVLYTWIVDAKDSPYHNMLAAKVEWLEVGKNGHLNGMFSILAERLEIVSKGAKWERE